MMGALNRDCSNQTLRIVGLGESDSNRDTIRQALWPALDAAQAQYSTTLSEFQQIISEVSTGLPSLDDIFRLEKAASARRRAFESYMEALSSLSAFNRGHDC